MKKPLVFIALAAFLLSSVEAGAAVKRNNYVVFNLKGDCHQEDCIALMKDLIAASELCDCLHGSRSAGPASDHRI